MSNEEMSLDQVLSKHVIPERHSFFQIKNFIIGKECTPQAQMWQILRELKTRRDNLESIQLEIAEAKDALLLIEEGLRLKHLDVFRPIEPDVSHQVEIRRLERGKQAAEKSIANLESRLVYIKEETAYLLAAFNSIKKQHGYEEFDNTQAQKKYWNEKLLEELSLRTALGRPIEIDLIKTALSLDDDMPAKQQIVGALQRLQQDALEARKLTAQKETNV